MHLSAMNPAMSHTKTTSNTKIHDKFAPGNGADLIIQSSNNVQFYVHSQNLEFAAGAFPRVSPTDIRSEPWEVVHLSETADVLEILFEFAYPRRHPILDDTPVKLLLKVSDAAGKYDFYMAARMCQISLGGHISSNPLEIFRLAVKHDYPDAFIDEVAVELCPIRITSTSDPRTHVTVAPAWIVYCQKWRDVFKKACKRHLPDDISLSLYDNKPKSVVPGSSSRNRCNSLVAWMLRISDRQSLASIKKELEKDPSLQSCTKALNACPCPPPFDKNLKLQNVKFKCDKSQQISVIIKFIAREALKLIEEIGSFASLMKKLTVSEE